MSDTPAGQGREQASITAIDGTGGLPALVAEVLRQTAAARSVHDALDTTLDILKAAMAPTWCAVWLFDDETDTWFISHSRGLSGSAAELRFPRGAAIPCLVGERGRSQRFDTLDDEQGFKRLHEVHYRMRSALYVPMSVQSRSVGVIALYSDQPSRFTDDDQQLLELVAAHMSYVVTALGLLDDRKRVVELDARSRLAQDLHDGMLQILSSLQLYAYDCRDSLGDRDMAKASSALDAMTTTIGDAIAEVREAIASLRSGVVLDSVESMLPRMKGRLEASGLSVEVPDDYGQISPAVSDVLASVAREATNNILKHSDAKHVRFSLEREGRHLVFECVDDGDGQKTFEEGGDHLGLSLLSERVAGLGGELTHCALPDGGFLVRCRIADGDEA
ncbi:MAG: GAF domain-containing protein [Actinomadura sp.]